MAGDDDKTSGDGTQQPPGGAGDGTQQTQTGGGATPKVITPKAARGHQKSRVTRAIGALRRYTAEQNMNSIQTQLGQIKVVFDQFEQSHETYHNSLTDENEIDISDTYFQTVENKYIEAVKTANDWITSQTKPDTSAKVMSSAESVMIDLMNAPPVAIDSFSGDPLYYHEFIARFNETIHDKPMSDSAKLSRLLQFTSGEARESIRHTSLLESTAGYEQARTILSERYGNNFLIAHKLIDKLRFGKSVSSSSELQQLANDLHMASETLTKLNLYSEIENQRCIIGILQRCPRYVKLRWEKKALKTKIDKKSYPNFHDFVDLIQRIAFEAADPLYGRGAQNSQSSGSLSSQSSGSQSFMSSPDTHISGDSFGASANDSRSPTDFRNKSQGPREDTAPCVLCSQRHSLFRCDEFKRMNPRARLDLARKNRLCFLCLKSNCRVAICTVKYRCSVPNCNQAHTKFLHLDVARDRSNMSPGDNHFSSSDRNSRNDSNPSEVSGGARNDSNPSDVSDGARSGDLANAKGTGNTQVYLPLVPVKVAPNDPNTYYCLLDSGSTNSFICADLASRLNLKSESANIEINTISSQSKINKMVSVNLSGTNGSGPVCLNNVLVVNNIPARHPDRHINLDDYSHLRDLPLVHEPNIQASILIGMDNAHLLVPYQIRANSDGKNMPFATETYFGWALNGPVPGISNHVQSNLAIVESSIEEKIENLWKIETNIDDSKWSQDDKWVVDMWDRETVFENGQYSVPLPFPDNTAPIMPDNKANVYHRLQSNCKRLDKSGLKERYNETFDKLLTRGYVEKVPSDEIDLKDGSVWFIPHFHVLNETKDNKLRIVMDCSAKYHGTSINEECLSGPNLMNNILHVLLRFRQYKIAISGDIESFYLRVKVPENQRNYLRFYWYNQDGVLTQYRFTSHLFGGLWSSSAAIYALHRTVQDQAVSDLVRNVVLRSFYVDDLMSSVRSLEEAREVVFGTRGVLGPRGFNVRNIMSNDDTFNAELDEDIRAAEIKEISYGSTIQSKALGVSWLLREDYFYFVNRPIPNDGVLTRRVVLSQISSMFDPLGQITPVIIRGKMIFQDLTRLKLDWNTPVPDDIASKWLSWLDSLCDLEKLKFPRCLIPERFEDGAAELIHFSDSSLKAYGACSYLRVVNKFGEIHVALIISKARLVPLKQLSIPRLELCAAVEAVRLDVMLRREMDIDFIGSTFFSDSEIVLAYIRNERARYKIFVANRISEIRRHSSPNQWHHVEGKLNPSDILSRGCDVDSIPMAWYRGPDFLYQYKSTWPSRETSLVIKDDPEIVTAAESMMVSDHQDQANHPLEVLVNHYSDYYRLKKAVAWWMRLMSYFRSKSMVKGPLLTREVGEAERLLLRHVQSRVYAGEMERLVKGQPVGLSSEIVKLDPIIQDGIIVVGGRLRYSGLSESAKHPIILPGGHRLSKLIAKSFHEEAHLGIEWTLSLLRSRFWITKARNMIKGIKRQCVTCRKLYSPPVEQKMSDLPPSRCEPFQRPFTYTGFDVFGNFYVKQGRSEVKRYALLFTCLTSRGLHIELLRDLKTQTFLNAFVRMISRRGCPKEVWCDNATSFVGARNELADSMADLNTEEITRFGRRLNIVWHFNTPYASHHGGVWESLIRIVRRVLSALLNPDSRLTDDKLQTVMCEAENLINSRPITKVSDDVNDEAALTPNHLLLMGSNPADPLGKFNLADKYRQSWRHVQNIVNSFWNRWLTQYLVTLQSRQRWQRVRDNVKVNDVMLIIDQSVPRGSYPLGIVVEVIKNRDGLVRSVKLRSKGKMVVRPLTKVVFLEGDGPEMEGCVAVTGIHMNA